VNLSTRARALATALAAAAALLAGCASAPPQLGKETVVILPPPDGGKVGGVIVHRGDKEIMLDNAYEATRIDSTGKLEGLRMDAVTVKTQYSAALDALPGKPASFALYFLEGKDEFTQESKAEVDRILAELKRRPSPDIVVIGHTDTVGNEAANDKLSLARAERVRELLVKLLNLSEDRIQVAGRGKRELLIPTAESVSEARNRRVEINVR
jgi:outer membrane protein OmpA-like peptidoglycan-associated protein